MIRWFHGRAPLAPVIFLACLLLGCAHKKKPQEPPPIVEVARPVQAQVRDWDEVVGRFLSIQSVDVRPRVAGYVTRVAFRDGQDVKRGQLLFVIDPRPYQAALDRARATVQRQRATLANAQLELNRARSLIEAKAASDQEYQMRLVAAQQAAADLATARADQEQAALNIGFTRVRAAVAGRISDRRVNPGNLVTADQTILTSIVTLDPIRFEFTAPESLFLKYDRSGGRGALGAAVEVRLQNERSFQHQGRIEFIDNQVSSTAGTIRGRAIIPNADRKIAPGLFGQMRIAGEQAHAALLVPDGVVRHDQDREMIDIVTPQGVVKEQKVETGPLVGGLRVVLKGLDQRSEVIVAGRQKAKPGQKIRAKLGRVSPPREDRTEPEQDYDAPGRRHRDCRRAVAVKFSHFFIDRPVFAGVISLFIVLIGALAYPFIPTAQFPELVPPTVTVTATYPGATAETLADTVAAPLEESINGVEKAEYLSSQSTGDGRMQLTITFKHGTNLDTAQEQVQDRVSSALSKLPEQVQRGGVIVRKASPDLLLAIHLYSPDHSLDTTYISNYYTLNIQDQLLRTEGVGDVTVRGQRDYAIRIWIDPNKAAERQLSAQDIVTALQNANVQVSTGVLNQAPEQGMGANQLAIDAKTRLSDPREFADIVIKSDPVGGVTRVSDIGRVELGAQDYTSDDYLSRTPAIFAGVLQLPGANAIETGKKVRTLVDQLQAKFPPGLKATIIYDTTDFIRDSLKAVEHTLFEALIIVSIVVIVFLQTWRAAIIPLLAIPVSLVGTFAVILMAGFSLNTLSLFGLVLAIGIVVDDAIVVVENVQRLIEEGSAPLEAAHKTMDEVGGALIGIALTLTAVFVPAALIPGITGDFYRQFALTIAVATLISLLVSLTLSPALAAIILKPRQRDDEKPENGWRRWPAWAADKFNAGFDWVGDRYGRLTRRTVRAIGIVMIVYAVLIGITGWRIYATPAGFIPDQDQGNLIANVTMPEGTSLDRTRQAALRVVDRILKVPGVKATNLSVGLDATTNTPDSAAAQIYLILDPFEERAKKHVEFDKLLDQLRQTTSEVVDTQVRILRPPPVRSIGTAGGVKLIIEDRHKQGFAALRAAADKGEAAGQKQEGLQQVRTTFNTDTPRLYADVDRTKANTFGVTPMQVFNTLQTYFASTYVNDFTFEGHTYQVRAQADAPFRRTAANALNLQVRSSTGDMVPLGSVATLKRETGPFRVLRYNLFPAAEVQGSPVPGTSSGEALKFLKQAVTGAVGSGFETEWTEIGYQEDEAGSIGYVAFVLAAVFAFLLLAALYESWLLPLAVLLIVPMCLLAALLGVTLRGLDDNILTQVGLIVLIGLAAKNAILIVEFAKQDHDEGQERREAAINSARTRLRPILMTSFAFILGTVPLAFASGAGAELRQALGTAVFFGMIGVTVFGLLFTPAFYVLFQGLSDRRDEKRKQSDSKGSPAEPDMPQSQLSGPATPALLPPPESA